eukprot:TRINITY_DN11631_c0_g1_i1.p1 TRINITY_DN11631_c0_g1~~TRINITY_DN11631_c0_g1_i1.p1  ORF type:complete len:549 (+),score=64.07 TRINITY_DN11631_c0_g1_i1:195-1841(+)
MSLDKLCSDTLLETSTWLELRDRIKLSQTSKKFKNLLSGDTIKSIDMSNTIPRVVEKVLEWAGGAGCSKSLLSLNLHGCPSIELTNLLPSVFENNPRIQRLSLQHCPHIDDTVIESVAQHLRDLRQISLYDTGRGRISKSVLSSLFKSCDRIEVIDLREQRFADDESARELAALPNLRKISFVATSITERGFYDLMGCKSIQRVGSLGLRYGNGPHLMQSESVEELQIGHTMTPLKINIAGFPKIKFLGVSAKSLLYSSIDWNDLARSSTICQINAEENQSYPPEFVACLIKIRKQLIHLGVGEISDKGLQSSIVEMVKLKHLTVKNPSLEMLKGAVQLPQLELIKISKVDTIVFQSLVEWMMAFDGDIFPKLTDLQISFYSESDDDEFYEQAFYFKKFLRHCVHLTSFSLGWHYCDTLQVLQSLPAAQIKHLYIKPDVNLTSSLEVIKKMVNLETFDYPSQFLGPEERDMLSEVAYSLPKLIVANLEQVPYADLFSSWVEINGSGPPRYFRHFNPFGYLEETGIKPNATFLTIFEDYSDSRFGTIRP